MDSLFQWLGDNSSTLFAMATAIVSIWGGKQHVARKVVETIAEANQARGKLVLNDALKKIDAKADDITEDIERWHNELDYGEALLMRRSGDPLKRAKAEARLRELDPPKYLGDK